VESIDTPLPFIFSSPQEMPADPRKRTVPVEPQARISLKNLVSLYQEYQFKVRISLPESPTNFDIGMFMIKITLEYENSHMLLVLPH